MLRPEWYIVNIKAVAKFEDGTPGLLALLRQRQHGKDKPRFKYRILRVTR